VVDIDETIYLQRFPQPFGGHRWLFICPSTNRRCTVLCQPPGARRFRSRGGFRCRLQYRSQQLSPVHRYQHIQAAVATWMRGGRIAAFRRGLSAPSNRSRFAV
jgi:hypothetical protein